ncbi:MAG: tyrosine-type recombinase/integrase [Desulfobacterales bacterium]|nr:tyrosine-type recombinase/integrase [Desulfobacterales bacterium]
MSLLDKIKQVLSKEDKNYGDPIIINGVISTLDDFNFKIPDIVNYVNEFQPNIKLDIKPKTEIDTKSNVSPKSNTPIKPNILIPSVDKTNVEVKASELVETIQPIQPVENEKEKIDTYINIAQTGRLPSIDKFWNYLKIQNKAKETIETYKYSFKYWTEKAREVKKTLYDLKIFHIEQILENVHPSTVRKKIAFLKKLAKWYLREGHPKLHNEVFKFDSPKLLRRIPGDLGTKTFTDLKDLGKEWCAYGKREGLWLSLMLMGGLRISEIKTIELKSGNLIKVLGKGNKERLIPIPDWLFVSLELHPKEGNGGWAKNRKLIWKKLNVENIRHPHNLRHTYASECLRRGKNIVEIKELLGHADISTTNIYARANVPTDVAILLDK